MSSATIEIPLPAMWGVIFVALPFAVWVFWRSRMDNIHEEYRNVLQENAVQSNVIGNLRHNIGAVENTLWWKNYQTAFSPQTSVTSVPSDPRIDRLRDELRDSRRVGSSKIEELQKMFEKQIKVTNELVKNVQELRRPADPRIFTGVHQE